MRMKSLMMTTAAAAMLSLSFGAVNASLIIEPDAEAVPQGALDEPQLASGPGFPLMTFGYQHPSELQVAIAGKYKFEYLGSGDSADTNGFCVGTDCFLSIGPGGTTMGSSMIHDSFEVVLPSGLIEFRYTNMTTGCSILSGADSTPEPEDCHYLVALEDSPDAAAPALGPQYVAFIGFSDRPNDLVDRDFQDLTVKVSAVELFLDIDIKPGSFPNAINRNNKGVIAVAVLGNEFFDATTVDGSTVAFGPGGATPVHRGDGHISDVNNDGFPDWVGHFRTQDTGIVKGDTEATLTGETTDGIAFSGSDSVKTVGK